MLSEQNLQVSTKDLIQFFGCQIISTKTTGIWKLPSNWETLYIWAGEYKKKKKQCVEFTLFVGFSFVNRETEQSFSFFLSFFFVVLTLKSSAEDKESS